MSAFGSGYSYPRSAKFARVMDPDGNKIELWEPKAWDEKNKGA